jgi:regulator of cell morphogenesis and NO signaling
MTTIDVNTTLGELVTEQPALARELERHGLDYCCHGRRSLADACADADLDPAVFAADLEQAIRDGASRREPWADLEPAALADHIEAVHHGYLWAELPRLGALLDRVVAVHGGRHPELGRVAAAFAEVRADLEPHLLKEERVLFPMIRELARATTPPVFHCGRITNPISMMMLEHHCAGQILADLRTAADGFCVPDDGCASYRALYEGLAELEADTHQHIHKENNVLFPAVVALEQRLTEADH